MKRRTSGDGIFCSIFVKNKSLILACALFDLYVIMKSQRTGMLLNCKPPTNPQATSPRPLPNGSKASERATNSRLYWGYGFWQDTYDGEYHSGIAEADRRSLSPITKRLRCSYIENSRRCSLRMQWNILSPTKRKDF